MRNNHFTASCILQLTLLYTVLNIILHTVLYNTLYIVQYTVPYTLLYKDAKRGKRYWKYTVYWTDQCTVNFSQYPSVQGIKFSIHWCIVVYISVPQQQNIFFSWMKRPSEDSSRRIIPVQFWEVLHTFKYFFLKFKIKNHFFFCVFFCDFYNFFEFLKTLLLDLTLKKRAKKAEENTQA